MPRQTFRKRRTREHVIADLSVNYVEKCILQCGWTVQRLSPDYGLDLLMNTFNRRGEIETGEVRFQLKATDSINVIRHHKAIAVRVEWRDLVYWLNDWMPVILVVYDAKGDRAWWLHVQESVRELGRSTRFGPSATVAVHLPLANALDTAAIRQFRKYRDAVLAEG
jgi:hypothetical protein